MENEMINSHDSYHICRGCLTENNLIEINKDQENLIEIYKRITTININEIDDYPYWFCTICITKIQEYNKFRQICLQSYNTLKYIAEETKILIKIETDNSLLNRNLKTNKIYNKIVENRQKSIEIKCVICLEMFNTNDDLMLHNTNQHNTDDYRCNCCQTTFKYPNLLTVHLRNHKVIENNFVRNKFACNRCDKSYTTIANLQLHVNSHLGIKPFKCEICLRHFTKKTSLNTHLAAHSNVKEHLCSECGTGFTTPTLLHRHQFKHNGLSPYKCRYCSACCSSASDLKVHIRTHTGERPYLCSTCGKSFKRCTYFKAHKRIHTGEKPYQCTICEKAFTQSCDLRSHSRIHTGERPYCCPICNKRFVQHSALSTHLKRHSK